MVRLPAFDPIEFLLDRKYPSPVVFSTFGDVDRRPTPQQRGTTEALRHAYRLALEAKSPEEIGDLVTRERATIAAENQAKAAKVEQERFFNQPGAIADFQHWSRASYWTLEEATALALGEAPEVVNAKALAPLTSASPFAKEFFRLFDLTKRAVWAGQLWEPSLPTIFLAWAKRMEIQVMPALAAAVEARGLQIADWKTLYDGLSTSHAKLKAEAEVVARTLEETRALDKQAIDLLRSRISELELAAKNRSHAPIEKPLSTRARETLLKILIGMAVKGYAFDPLAKRSDQISEIASDLAEAGVTVTDDTVRKYLREATDLLPPAGDESLP